MLFLFQPYGESCDDLDTKSPFPTKLYVLKVWSSAKGADGCNRAIATLIQPMYWSINGFMALLECKGNAMSCPGPFLSLSAS